LADLTQQRHPPTEEVPLDAIPQHLVLDSGLAALLGEAQESGCLGSESVRDYLDGRRICQDEEDGSFVVVPHDTVNQKKLNHVLELLKQKGIKLIDELWLLDRGSRWRKDKEFDKAIAAFSQLIQLHQSRALFMRRGITWHGEEAYLACKERQRVLFMIRGITWKAQREYDRAIADFDEAIQLDPTRSHDYGWRGTAWEAKREYAKAIADFEECIRLDPDDVSTVDFCLSRIAQARDELKRTTNADTP
jgi:tetratricopeptide (TPR) repeat protein